MKKFIFILVLFLTITIYNYSQITITEVKKQEIKIVTKPEKYDSLSNWESHERLYDYKQYIGQKAYLPPSVSEHENHHSESPLLFSNHFHTIDIDTAKNENKIRYRWYYSDYTNSRQSGMKEFYFDKISTLLYEPCYIGKSKFSSNEGLEKIEMKSHKSIGDSYFTIIDVIYGDNYFSTIDSLNDLQKIAYKEMKENIRNYTKSFSWRSTNKEFIYEAPIKVRYVLTPVLYVLKHDESKDTIYSMSMKEFILVPYFVKRKQLFENQELVFDFQNEYHERREIDLRYEIRKEDNNGTQISENKIVQVKSGSNWLCSSVTLLKNDRSYDIHYILENSHNEQIAVKDLRGFLLKNEVAVIDADKRRTAQELAEKRQHEEKIREEKEKKYRIECIKKYGQHLGGLIAEGKLEIGMTKEMCKEAWGSPYDFKKVTTALGDYDLWYYSWGIRLSFANGKLARIDR